MPHDRSKYERYIDVIFGLILTAFAVLLWLVVVAIVVGSMKGGG